MTASSLGAWPGRVTHGNGWPPFRFPYQQKGNPWNPQNPSAALVSELHPGLKGNPGALRGKYECGAGFPSQPVGAPVVPSLTLSFFLRGEFPNQNRLQKKDRAPTVPTYSNLSTGGPQASPSLKHQPQTQKPRGCALGDAHGPARRCGEPHRSREGGTKNSGVPPKGRAF